MCVVGEIILISIPVVQQELTSHHMTSGEETNWRTVVSLFNVRKENTRSQHGKQTVSWTEATENTGFSWQREALRLEGRLSQFRRRR